MASQTLTDVVGTVRAHAIEMRRSQEQRALDAMTPAQRDAALLHTRQQLHEITIALQYAREGEMAFRSSGDLLEYIEAIAWASPAGE